MRPWIGIVFGVKPHSLPAVAPPENIKNRSRHQNGVMPSDDFIALPGHPKQKHTNAKRGEYDEKIHK